MAPCGAQSISRRIPRSHDRHHGSIQEPSQTTEIELLGRISEVFETARIRRVAALPHTTLDATRHCVRRECKGRPSRIRDRGHGVGQRRSVEHQAMMLTLRE